MIFMPILATEVAEPAIQTGTQYSPEIFSDEDVNLDKPWNVVLLDDDNHSYEYVIEMLGVLFGYTIDKAYRMACEVDEEKRVIVWSGHLEIAELKQEQIHEYGPDWRMASEGSMSAVLQQAR